MQPRPLQASQLPLKSLLSIIFETLPLCDWILGSESRHNPRGQGKSFEHPTSLYVTNVHLSDDLDWKSLNAQLSLMITSMKDS